MILNGVMALTLRYFTKFGKPAFQLLTASSSIELIVQKSASITHRMVKLVCVTKFTHSRVDTITQIYWTRLTLRTYNLPSKFHFTTICRNVLLFGSYGFGLYFGV